MSVATDRSGREVILDLRSGLFQVFSLKKRSHSDSNNGVVNDDVPCRKSKPSFRVPLCDVVGASILEKKHVMVHSFPVRSSLCCGHSSRRRIDRLFRFEEVSFAEEFQSQLLRSINPISPHSCK